MVAGEAKAAAALRARVVLGVGHVEIFNPASGLSSVYAPMAQARSQPSALLLHTGELLVAGGEGPGQVPGEGEGESIEGGDTLQPGMWGAQEDEYSTEGDGRDIRRQLRQERSDEWQREKARKWEMPADAGSLGAPGEAVDEPVVKSVDAFGVSAEWEMADWAVDEDTDAVAGMDVVAARRLEAGPGAWRLAGRVEPEHALAGIVWAAVLGAPRCRLTRHGR